VLYNFADVSDVLLMDYKAQHRKRLSSSGIPPFKKFPVVLEPRESSHLLQNLSCLVV
jgi:hypothetical protein